MSVSLENDIPRIEGIPAKDGAYWYYKRGQVVPNLVLVGGADGQRAFKDGPALHHYWYPGEFFVGPIEPPFATPDNLANERPGRYGEEMYPHTAAGMAVSDQR